MFFMSRFTETVHNDYRYLYCIGERAVSQRQAVLSAPAFSYIDKKMIRADAPQRHVVKMI